MFGYRFGIGCAAALGAMLVALPGWAGQTPARAADLDYTKLVRERVLHCLHPAAHADTATVEVAKPAEVNGDISTVRLKVFYSGIIKKHSLDLDLMVRQAGSIRQMKVNVLADTGAEMRKCELANNWVDF
ncbi:MAG: hypothetical protein JO047_09110 [Alphaproteobacteria bacterium]|nr:hypothetical protein [Alphaproteobacteria bacterium]